MKLPRLFPHPVAWVTALTFYAFSLAISAMWIAVIPALLDWFEGSPRLFWSGVLLLWLAPILLGAMMHRLVGHVVARLDGGRAITSAWAGLFAWLAIVFTWSTVSFVLCVIDPPPIDSSFFMTGLARFATLRVDLYTAIWIVVAALVANVERDARKSD